MTTPRSGLPAVPYRPGDRAQFLAQMLAELVRTPTADGRPFGLKTKSPDDPTVALLDAWATVADVIAFYQERIANEAFLRTATQPGSLLAIAQLTGYRPRPGLAASVWLAYDLLPDPADTAVVLPAGLLVQSVPGTGELPQTFETTLDLVARPSWNRLKVRTSAPLTAPNGLSAIVGLTLAGATTGLAANDVILLSDGATTPVPVTVQAVTADLTSQVTSVTLQGSLAATATTGSLSLAAIASPPPAATGGIGNSVAGAIDQVVSGLRKVPPSPPASAAALNRGWNQVFASGSDALPRLVAALDPALDQTIYKALATTSIGPAAVTSALALQVQATPFGVGMPPRPVFDSQGQQIGTEEFAIGDVQVLSAQMIWGRGGSPRATAQVSVQGPGGVSAQTAIDIADVPPSFPLGSVGTVTVAASSAQGESANLAVTFEPAANSGLAKMVVTFTPAADGSVTVAFADGSQFVWVPALRAAQRFTLGNQRVTIAWPAETTASIANQHHDDGDVLLSVSVSEALPLASANVLDLGATYPGILPGSWVAIDRVGSGERALAYPLVARVVATGTAAVSRYGMSGSVTQLTLDSPWVDPDARWLSDLRPLTVHAQSASLDLLPVPLDGPLAGATIDLDGLYAGIEAGRRILVTGIRADLPAGATVAAGEQAMVASVTQTTTAGAADTPHTVLLLAAPLTFSYQLASVQIYGNVVPAHQGATITEPLGGTSPGDPNPSFTLSQAPVLADPSATSSGSVSSLTLQVRGRTWTPVTRLDASTPPRSYLTGIDSQGRTTIELSSPLPTGVSAVVATYRAGLGSAGNVRAHQVTQLLSRPLTISGVDNPLPASGGSDGDGPDDLRSRASVGLVSLGRLVSAADAADLVRSWAGVGKAEAQASPAGGVTVTVAGVDPVALDPTGALCTSLAGALTAAGDPGVPVAVVPASLYLIVLAAQVRTDPAFDWTDLSAALQAALFAAFGYGQRGLDQDLVISEVIAVAHSVPGVESFSVIAATLIPTTATAADIDASTSALPPPPANGRLALPVGGAVAFLSPAMSDTLILQQVVG